MKIDARKNSAIRAEAATESRSVVVEIQALAVTRPSPTSDGAIYEWATTIAVDPLLTAREGENLSDVIKAVFGAACDALWERR